MFRKEMRLCNFSAIKNTYCTGYRDFGFARNRIRYELLNAIDSTISLKENLFSKETKYLICLLNSLLVK